MGSLLKSKFFVISVIVVLAVIGFIVYESIKISEPNYEFIEAERVTLSEEISVTGKVVPSEDVSLAFETSGKVSSIYVGVGDQVLVGDQLVRLNSEDVQASLLQARASVRAEKAKLADLTNGTRPEEISVKEASYNSSLVSFRESQKSSIDVINDAYTKADDAVKGKLDQFFNNPNSTSPSLNINTKSLALALEAEEDRVEIGRSLSEWLFRLPTIDQYEQADQYLLDAESYLKKIKDYVTKVAVIVNDLDTSGGYSETTLASYKADALSARTNINTALSNILNSEEAINEARSAVDIAEQQLDLAKAPATIETVNAQRASVDKAEALVLSYQSELNKRLLLAPIQGVVTTLDVKIGEIVTTASPVVKIISESNFEIEAKIPEIDIANIKIGNLAEVTLDTYGNDQVFQAHVISIDPQAVTIEGVPTYKVTLSFDEYDERVRSGMTADVNIVTETREGVIAIPSRSVIRKDGNQIVRILDGTEIVDVDVTTGIRGALGQVEITSGIKEGDKVITVIREDN